MTNTQKPSKKQPAKCGACGHVTDDLMVTDYGKYIPARVKIAADLAGIEIPDQLVCADAIGCLRRLTDKGFHA